MIRRTLAQRRAAETFDLRFWNQLFTVTVGFYPDGTPAEVFVDIAKSGADIAGIGFGHRLDGDRRVAAHFDLAQLDLSGFASLYHEGTIKKRRDMVKLTNWPKPPGFKVQRFGIRASGLRTHSESETLNSFSLLCRHLFRTGWLGLISILPITLGNDQQPAIGTFAEAPGRHPGIIL